MIRLLLLITALGPAWAGAQTASPAELEALRKRIDGLQSALEADEQRRDDTQKALRDTEKRIGALAAEARDLDRQEADARQELKAIRARQAELAAEQGRQLDWLVRTARAGYMAGAQARLKLLLNQQQPEQISRLLRYQDYFQTARQTRVTRIRRDLDELLSVATQVEAAKQKLAQRQAAVARQQARLDSAREERAQALARLNHRISDTSTELGQLRQDEARLEKLLRDMRNTLDDIPARPRGEPFGKLRNKLPWPASRKIAARFGSLREGPIRWNGVLLDVAPGTPVRAIHPGRVVYADWLRGYGLLTIVDHGDGFLTLYGHNQSLLRQVGEWVALGDILALAGDSGGRSEAGLYFEIRRDGKPINPDKWCNSRVTLPPVALN